MVLYKLQKKKLETEYLYKSQRQLLILFKGDEPDMM